MACNRRIAYRYNSYATRKIPYTKMSIGIKMVELSKQPLFIACGGKEKN
jgi:hypothetical protein